MSQQPHITPDNTVHILNGDALRECFPPSLSGEIIVARECLVDGDVKGDTFDQLMTNRAAFIEQYPECSKEQYLQSTVPEFKKILALAPDRQVVCWFEQDLFCQVNFWYVCSLLIDNPQLIVYLVRPNKGNEYSFAHMSTRQLIVAFDNKQQLTKEQLKLFAGLWFAYQQQNWQQLESTAAQLSSDFLFVKPAVDAQLARLPDANGLGLPERELLAIMRRQQHLTFTAVFQEFYQSMALYSFGDLQVKAMYDRLLPLV
ncbi:hypothetical protein tinsulaeT_31650 [Thalassotalea insulae]|uniref:DUF1835 domain-containing protein n=1 Tax=Thalassotalea insulae TaxID=2056778 RepID=A0ABQ6GZA2_9GAMM|nr:DUF1835 domain-containing protein [Thalassotalea insulae]GLX79825.1 hypothetical protein tinsulaeT_31650 [Thalassotalea insulae]